MKHIKRLIMEFRTPFLSALLLLAAEAFCDLLQPTVLEKIVDIGIKQQNIAYILRMGAMMLVITVIGAAAATGRNIISSNVSQKFGSRLRSEMFRKINTFSFDSIDRFETGSLITRLTNDAAQVQNFVHGLMRIVVKAPLLGLGSIVMAFVMNPQMALILTAVIPVIAILIYISTRIGYPMFRKVQSSMDNLNSAMREYLSGIRVVKAFDRAEFEMARFEESSADLAVKSVSAMRIMALFTPGITLAVNIAIAVVLWLGGLYVNIGSMQVGQIMAFINYMTQILFSLMMINSVFNMFIRAKASAERVEEVLGYEGAMPDAEPEHNDAFKHVQVPEGSIEFRDVTFRYAGSAGEPVLKNISFTCRQGETIGIIGSTGSGKSTLISLIPRFYDVSSGAVMVNGTDVREMNMQKLRDMIAVVQQKTVLFTGTIEENIRWGKEDATRQEIEEAAMNAQAHSFITSFPEGYNTMLGQGGVNLSGGQKQRISIARALVRKPDILILDDCTSAVDGATERAIRNGIRRFSENTTCIIITQRISSVMQADRIFVMDNGALTNIGTHNELMRTSEVYREIYRSQIGGEDYYAG